MMKTNYKKWSSLFLLVSLIGSPVVVLAESGNDGQGANGGGSSRAMREARYEQRETRQANREQRMEDRQQNREARMENRQEEREAKHEENQANRQEKFCERFTENASNISSRLEERKGKFAERKENRMTRSEDNRTKRDENLATKRAEAKTRREAMYARLLEKADTDTEKAAVEKFKTTTEAAVLARQTAVDKAIADFRSSVDSLIASRKDSMTNTGDTFKAAVDAAISQAKSDCAAGKDVKTVRSNFMSAMATAREGVQAKRQSTDKIGDDIKALAATRNAALKAAKETFHTAMVAARKELKAAFGESTTDGTAGAEMPEPAPASGVTTQPSAGE